LLAVKSTFPARPGWAACAIAACTKLMLVFVAALLLAPAALGMHEATPVEQAASEIAGKPVRFSAPTPMPSGRLSGPVFASISAQDQ